MPTAADGSPGARPVRALLLLVLLAAPQAFLYGPSLVGQKVLLPLDILRQPGVYLPLDPAEQVRRPEDHTLSDLVYALEIYRRYATEAVRAGRLPLWNPLTYCGTPFLAANLTAVLYPLRVVDYLFPGPVAIAWVQLLKSVLAGVGAYLFARAALGVAFWPAALGASLWPVCAFLVLWAGYPVSQVAANLPWVLLATDGTVRRPRSLWPLGLALATAVILVSGHAAVAAHVLIASALYALFRVAQRSGRSARRRGGALAAAGGLVAGWVLGVLLSGPQTLPTLDYMRESWRIQHRQEGEVETPPVGLAALPAVVMPYWYGSWQRDTVYVSDGNRQEGPPAAYAGLLALLALAPLGFAHRRLRGVQVFWLALWCVGLSQVLGVPGLVRIFALPVLNSLRNNRLTMLSAWATVAMATIGLDALWRGGRALARLVLDPVALLAGLAVWCWAGARPAALPTASEIESLRQATVLGSSPVSTGDTTAIQRWFAHVRVGYAGLALAALGLWLMVRVGARRSTLLVPVLGLAALVEVIGHASGVNPQSEPDWYFPRVELYEQLRALGPGRVVGGPNTLPANLAMSQGLADPRGYDGADPARMVELLLLFPHRFSPPPLPYTAVQWWFPSLPSPLANLLGLRWFVTTGPQPPRAVLGEKDFWVQENRGALPRAFIAGRAQVVNDKAERLRLLAAPDFDPRALVLLESAVPLPDLTGDGDARIVVDEPERVVIELDVRAAGFLVLADRWAPGWHASVDGAERPVLIADHALRAVQVDSADRRVEFRYRPASFRLGLWAALAALVAMAGWASWVRRAAPAPPLPPPGPTPRAA